MKMNIDYTALGKRIRTSRKAKKISQALDVSLDYIILDSLADDSKSIVNLKSIIETMDEKTQSNIISTVKALCSYEKNN